MLHCYEIFKNEDYRKEAAKDALLFWGFFYSKLMGEAGIE
jgi:hypothetical protein